MAKQGRKNLGSGNDDGDGQSWKRDGYQKNDRSDKKRKNNPRGGKGRNFSDESFAAGTTIGEIAKAKTDSKSAKFERPSREIERPPYSDTDPLADIGACFRAVRSTEDRVHFRKAVLTLFQWTNEHPAEFTLQQKRDLYAKVQDLMVEVVEFQGKTRRFVRHDLLKILMQWGGTIWAKHTVLRIVAVVQDLITSIESSTRDEAAKTAMITAHKEFLVKAEKHALPIIEQAIAVATKAVEVENAEIALNAEKAVVVITIKTEQPVVLEEKSAPEAVQTAPVERIEADPIKAEVAAIVEI